MITINDLPQEILVLVFSNYIKSEGFGKLLKNVMPVCTSWKEVATVSSLWQHVSDFNLEGNQLVSLSKEGLLASTKSLELIPQAMYFVRKQRELLEVVKHCPSLKSLDLSYHQISRELFETLSKTCLKLESLTLQHTRGVTEEYWNLILLNPVLEVCGKNLKYLDLNHCKLIFDDKMIEVVADTCNMLEEFHLFYSYNFSYQKPLTYKVPMFQFPVAKFQKGCPRLRVLKLGRFKMNTEGASEANGFPNLHTFGARRSTFRRGDLSMILRKSSELKSLEFYNCIHDKTFVKDLLHLPSGKVEALILGKMDSFKALDLQKIVTRWKHTIKELELSSFQFNISRVLLSLVSDVSQPVIECLDLFESKVDLSVVQKLVRWCPRLRLMELSFSNCALPDGVPRSFMCREEVEQLLQY